MPLYEYQCENCGEVFELMQKFSDEPLTVHEKCGGKVQRLLSAPALQFKGSGWYVTDYAGSGKPADNGSGKAEKTDSSTPASSGDAKAPATKPTTSTETKE